MHVTTLKPFIKFFLDFYIIVLMDKAQQSLCHLEKIFLTEDLGTSQLFTTKGKVIIYYKSQMHKATCFIIISGNVWHCC